MARTPPSPVPDRTRPSGSVFTGRTPSPRHTQCNASAQDDDGGANAGSRIEIDDVVVGHADATGGDGLADRIGLVGAVNAIERAGKIHRAGAERIVDAAFHVARE